MVILRVTHNTGKVQEQIDMLFNSSREEVRKGILEAANVVKRDLRINIMRKGFMWTGKLYDSVRIKTRGKNYAEVRMRSYGVALDRQEPHYVPLKRGTIISRWAKQRFGSKRITGLSRVYRGPRGGLNFNTKSGSAGAIYVTPHPYIKDSLRSSHKEYTDIMNRRLRRLFR